MEHLPLYRHLLRQLVALQHQLALALDAYVTLVELNTSGWYFVPTESRLSLQMRHWPPDVFPIPPAAWVSPRKGTIHMNDTWWDYVFHGSGVTAYRQTTPTEVCAQFGALGEYAFNPWIIYLYLKTCEIEPPIKKPLIAANEDLFAALIQTGEIVEIPPRLSYSDKTFLLREDVLPDTPPSNLTA